MFKTSLVLLISFLVCSAFVSCNKRHNIGVGASSFHLGADTNTYRGVLTDDKALKALTIPCQDNHIFRLYYSDSVALLGLPDSITIVSYSKRTHLGYKECCIETTTSATDTWLSNGIADHPKISAYGGRIEAPASIDLSTNNNIHMLHYTSSQQDDSAIIYFLLQPE